MPEESGAKKLATVKLTMELREALDMLKQRYTVKTQSEAFTKFLKDVDPDLLTAAEQVANIKHSQRNKPKSKN